ncbi:MAG: MFS transporter [Chloroflexi bacterium]|nr:MFS transporter [Chloroflexota bacterium]MBI3931110.1 MFS transporter [Chloroflexota bacterium]
MDVKNFNGSGVTLTKRVNDRVSAARLNDRAAAGGIIASHTFQHLYNQGFWVILPSIYTSLGLTPIAAGLIGTIRQVTSGLASIMGGFLVDKFQHRRVLVLYLSLLAIGAGYLLVGLSPTYLLILISLALVGAAASMWHPPALGLLSQQFPQRRGLLLALHRSSGNVGDTVGPLVIGALLVVMTWQKILFGAFPLAVLIALLLWLVLRHANAWQTAVEASTTHRPIGEQFSALKEVLRKRELILLFLVSGVSGLGQGSLMLWLPLYLQETQGMGSVGIGIHLALLSGIAIASGPLLGLLSDRLGRNRVIFMILMIKTTLAVLLALVGKGIVLTILVGFLGAFLFALNPLVQAGALDIAEGKRLEGSMVGLLWGNNAAFSGAAPLLLGFLITSSGYGILFWYIAGMNLIAALMAFSLLIFLPRTQRVASS